MSKTQNQILDKLTTFFGQKNYLDQFQPKDLQKIAKKISLDNFKQILSYYCIMEFQDQLKNLLFATNLKASSVDLSLQNISNFDSKQQYQEEDPNKLFQKDILEFMDLQKIVLNSDTIQGQYSYKSFKKIELSNYVQRFPALKDLKDSNPKSFLINLKDEVKRLKKLLLEQKLISPNSSVMECLTKIQEQQNPENIFKQICFLKKHIIVIDIFQLQNLIKRSKQTVKSIQGQSGIVFIGMTGAGKSTSILSLLGHEMVIKLWNGMIWITPKTLINKEGVKYLIANPSSKSVTRSVNHIQMDEKFINRELGDEMKYYFIDTPGFKDTQGSTIDLSNSYGAASAIKTLKQARFVVILSGKGLGERNQGLKNMIDVLNELFPKYSQISQSVTFLFNRFSQVELKTMNAVILNVWQNFPKSSLDNQNVKSIFNDFKRKVQSNDKIMTLDPLSNDPIKIQSIIKSIMKCKAATSLSKYFSVTYGESVKNDIEKKCRILYDHFIHYFQANKLKECVFFLSELKKFNELLGGRNAPEALGNQFKKIQIKIDQLLNIKYTQLIKKFNKVINNASLDQKDVEQYLDEITKTSMYAPLKQYINISDAKIRLQNNGEQQIMLLEQSIKNGSKNIDHKTVKSLLLLLKGFHKQNVLSDLEEYFRGQLSKLSQTYELAIKLANYNDSISSYEQFKSLKNLYDLIIENCPQSPQESQVQIDKLIITHISQKYQLVEPFIEDLGACTPEKFKEISQVSIQIKKLEESFEYLRNITNFDDVQKQLSNFNQKMIQKVQDYLSRVEEYISGKKDLNSQTAKKITKVFKQRDYMKQIPHLKRLVIQKSTNIDHQVKICLQNSKQILSVFIAEIKNKTLNYNTLKKQINKLNQAAVRIERVTKFYENESETNLVQAYTEIYDFLEDQYYIIQEIRNNPIDLGNPEVEELMQKLGKVCQILSAFQLDENKQDRSDLLSKQQLIDTFKNIKTCAEDVFDKNIKQAKLIISNLQKQKYKQADHDVEKYKNVKIKEIDSCIKFLNMGKKIFSSIQQKQKQFTNTYESLVQQIQQWNEYQMTFIKNTVRLLSETQSEQPKIIIRNLKTKIQMFKQIESKYTEVKKIIQSQIQQFFNEVLIVEMGDLFRRYEQYLKTYNKLSNPFVQLQMFAQKCRLLSILDCYNDQSNKFTNLQAEASAALERCTTTLETKFKYVLDNKKYQDICKTLKIIYQKQNDTFTESEIQFCDLLRRQMGKIRNFKNRILQVNEMQTILELLQDLRRVIQSIEANKFQNHTEVAKIMKQIQCCISSLSQNIQKTYNNCVDQAEIYLRKDNLQQVFIEIKKLDRILKIVEGTQGAKIIKSDKRVQLQEGLSLRIKYYQKTILDASDFNNIKFREIFDTLFQQKITLGELAQLKKKIVRKIQDTINNRFIQVQKSDVFNKENLTDIRMFLQNLPEQFKNKHQYKKLQQQASSKYQKWQEEKKNINDKINSVQVFQGEYLNPKIIQYIKDDSADSTNKKTLQNSIKQALQQKVKVYEKQRLNIYLKQINESIQLKQPQQSQDVSYIYKKIYENIKVKCLQKIQDQIKVLNEIFIFIFNSSSSSFSSSKDKQVEKIYKDWIPCFVQSIGLVNLKFFKQIFGKQFSKQLIIRLQSFFSSLQKQWKFLCQKTRNLKIVLNLNEDDSCLKKQLQYLSNLANIQRFINDALKAFSQQKLQNQVLEYVINKLSEIKSKQVLPQYSKILEDSFLPKFSQLLQYSLYKDDFMVMDGVQMSNSMKQTYVRIKYYTFVLSPLLKAIRNQQATSKMEQIAALNQKLKKQAESIRDQILTFSQNPIMIDVNVQDIRLKQRILSKFSKQIQKIDKVSQQFQTGLRKYHVGLSQKSLKQIKRLVEATEQFNKNLKQINDNVILKKQNRTIELQNQFDVKAKEKYNKFKNDIQNQTPQNKLKIESNYKTQIQSLKTESDQRIKKQLSQIDNQALIYKCKFQSSLKNSLGEIAVWIEEMINIHDNLLKAADFKDRSQKIIQKIKIEGERKWMKLFAEELNKIGSTTSGTILAHHPEFKNALETHFKKNASVLTIQEVIIKVKEQNYWVSQDFIIQLKIKYNICYIAYKKWVDDYSYRQKHKMKQNLIKQLKNVDKQSDKAETNTKIVAKILALWSIQTSTQIQGTVSYPYEPHPVQITTLLILLGLVDTPDCQGTRNRFAQIKTGQGKSLILGVLCTFFALKSKKVDCVCYSSFLSGRDENLFKDLFSSLGIEKNIKYCTFNNLVQSFISNDQINLREYFDNVIAKKQQNHKNWLSSWWKKLIGTEFQGKIKDKILLMDESDVFFMNDFYGNTYSPSCLLKGESIKRLLQFVWNKRKQQSLKQIIQSSTQFKHVLSQFPRFQFFLKNQIAQIVYGVRNYKHDYQIIDNQIAYKNQDGYSSKISYGYKTIFAYFYENQRKNIAEISQKVNCIDVALCEISFAELPKMYENIIGVTGTLKNMSKNKIKIMKDQYKIQDQYIIPPVYEKSSREDSGYMIVPKENHYEQIIKNLEQQLMKRRPVLIFFQSFNDVSQFYESQEFLKFKKLTVVLNQRHDKQERQRRIIRAMQQGKISLITKAFARGTDFVIYQNSVIALGGAHLIVTFILEQKSDEVQVLGRVGRGGDPGSSIFIVSFKEIEDKLGLQPKILCTKSKQLIQTQIDKARQKKMQQHHLCLLPTIEKCKQKHRETKQLFTNIYKGENQKIYIYLQKLNFRPQLLPKTSLKIALVIDATGSMQRTFWIAKESIKKSIYRNYQIMKKKDVKHGFEIKVIIYRNYDCRQNKLMECSSFQALPDNLVKFVEQIRPSGGYGSQEALQVVYDQCLKIYDLNQIIVIADAPANTKQMTLLKRKYHKQSYWSRIQKFKTPLDRDVLVQDFKKRGIKIHSLPIGQYCKPYFQQVSKQTGGKCEPFSPGSANSKDHLINFMSMSILSQLGDSKDAGEQLVESYKATYHA